MRHPYRSVQERYNPSTWFVKQLLLANKSKLLDKATDEIVEILNKAFYPYSISFETLYGQQSGSSQQAEVGVVSGNYNEGTQEIEIQLNARDAATVFESKYFDEQLFQQFVRVVEYVVAHELIHRNQLSQVASSRLWQVVSKINPDLHRQDGWAYMTSNFEIQAFAKQAVQEFKVSGYSRPEILNFLRTPFSKDSQIGSNVMYELFSSLSPRDTATDPHIKERLHRFLKFAYEYAK